MLPSATTPKLLRALSNRSMSISSTVLLKTRTEKMMSSTTFEMTFMFIRGWWLGWGVNYVQLTRVVDSGGLLLHAVRVSKLQH